MSLSEVQNNAQSKCIAPVKPNAKSKAKVFVVNYFHCKALLGSMI